ncbi:SDR family NAD(P)-dependent oxidoreductase [Ramlibacter sp.]|uniref:SDR family NAD(P)-dependent oxidoreductase n=1 Tax=Ramlibacter sp. TaxID=1917967 RepID=UPI002FCBE078
MRLGGRVAVVTGASRGLGRAIALAFAQEGATVAVCYRSGEQEAAEVVGRITAAGGSAMAVQVDTASRPSLEAMAGRVVDRFGRLDILVNNAGVMNTTAFLDLTDGEWDRVLDTNLKGYFRAAQVCAREMMKRSYGRIVNVSSTRQVQANYGNTAYCASKGGIYMLNRTMAAELAPHGICVNSIAPGTIETDLNRSYLSDPAFLAKRVSEIPIGRLGEPDEVVGATIFLASEQASFCVGASIMIDGGQTLI